ncbi:ARM repeat-containing protein [Multifurca ochricompacta]|uniref:Nucleolar protein 9 n=1 Tax=Multifurca ochricompacta TaxID=376703 RepID=A0AAD4M4X7_9AGAM|nr:ARM repeat-containing protein [Multifurca ochricompacta]
MPKELRKRGKKHRKSTMDAQSPAQEQELTNEGPSSGPSWIIPRTDTDQVNPDAPFGYVDPEIKAYFRTVDDQLKEWQQNWDEVERDDDIDPNENRRMFLMAALQEISGKERELATDPECASGLERMAYSMDDFVRRVFMDSLSGSYEHLIKHRFASHVIQTLLAVASETIARESRGVLPKMDDPRDKGQLRTLTRLILDFSDVNLDISPRILPSFPALIMDQFASHVIRALFLLLCPQLFQSDVPHKSRVFVRSRKSAAWKARQGPLKSIFSDNAEKGKASAEGVQPPEFHEVAKRFVTTLRAALDANEVRSLAANKVACPVLKMAIEIEAHHGLSDEPSSLMDHVLVGLITAYHNDPSVKPEASDYFATLLRDPTSSHLLETIVSRCPGPVFDLLWPTYLERNLRKLAVHPIANFVIAKALERAQAEQLAYALGELRDSFSRLRQTRIGVIRSLIERAATLNVLEGEVSEAICSAFQVNTEDDRKAFVLCALTLKSTSEYAAAVKAKAATLPSSDAPEGHSENYSQHSRVETATDALEPTTTGALLLQSLLGLHAPHNAVVLDSIESLPPRELLALAHHPAASRVLDAIIDGPTIPPRARRALLRALEAQFADVIDNRIGTRVGARCWAAADPYFKEKLARALLPHTARLAGSSHAQFFRSGLALPLLRSRPEEWRRLYATPSSGTSGTSATSLKVEIKTAASPMTAPARAEGRHLAPMGGVEAAVESVPTKAHKKRKRSSEMDEIDALFDNARGGKVTRSGRAHTAEKSAALATVVDAIKAVPHSEGKKKRKRPKP